jgi:hypothetical protein
MAAFLRCPRNYRKSATQLFALGPERQKRGRSTVRIRPGIWTEISAGLGPCGLLTFAAARGVEAAAVFEERIGIGTVELVVAIRMPKAWP